jgi:hypothetical protein
MHVDRTCQLSPTSRVDERDSSSLILILSSSSSIQGKPQLQSSMAVSSIAVPICAKSRSTQFSSKRHEFSPWSSLRSWAQTPDQVHAFRSRSGSKFPLTGGRSPFSMRFQHSPKVRRQSQQGRMFSFDSHKTIDLDLAADLPTRHCEPSLFGIGCGEICLDTHIIRHFDRLRALRSRSQCER